MSAAPPPDRPRLIPAPVRGPAAVLSACCAVGFLVLAVKYHGTVTYGRFDRWASDSVPRWRDLPHATLAPLTDLLPTVFLVLVGAVTIALLTRRRWVQAAFAVLGPGVTLLVTEVGKLVVGRRHSGELSLPSGHTAAVTTAAVVVALLAVGRSRAHPRLAAAVGVVAVTGVAGAIAFLLVALHWHYATDTLAGYCVAVGGTLGVAFALDALAARRVGAGAAGRRTDPVDRLPQTSP